MKVIDENVLQKIRGQVHELFKCKTASDEEVADAILYTQLQKNTDKYKVEIPKLDMVTQLLCKLLCINDLVLQEFDEDVYSQDNFDKVLNILDNTPTNAHEDLMALFGKYRVVTKDSIQTHMQGIYDMVPESAKDGKSKEECILKYADTYFSSKGIRPSFDRYEDSVAVCGAELHPGDNIMFKFSGYVDCWHTCTVTGIRHTGGSSGYNGQDFVGYTEGTSIQFTPPLEIGYNQSLTSVPIERVEDVRLM